MKSHATRKFWGLYRELPADVQRVALKQYKLWLLDPRHPSVQFKKIASFWSARITDDYRTLGIMDGDTVIWFWIGPHSTYAQLIKRR